MTPKNSEVRHLSAASGDPSESITAGLERVALDAIRDPMMILDTNNRVVLINRAMAKRLGRTPDDVRGMLYSRLLHGESAPPPGCPHARLLIDGQEHIAKMKLDCLGGEFTLVASPIVDDDERVTGSVLVARDANDRLRVRDAGNLSVREPSAAGFPESLGVLAGGIAHDFNNLLTTIQGNAELAKMDLPADSPVQQNIEEIDSSSSRAAEICQMMLDYAGKGRIDVEPLDLSDVVREMRNDLRVEGGQNVAFDFQLEQGLPGVAADPVQLRRMLASLVTNAREAMDGDVGVVTVRTGLLNCGLNCKADARFGHELVEGRCVYLQVTDTGSGMDRATLESLCDPYFSTKFAGRGLSLSAVLGIVRSHGGAIRVWSEPGQGSTFLVLFPFLKSQEEEPAAATDDPAAWKSSGTVLIVDDEKPVRTVGRRMMERMGFDVLTANDGREGVETFRANVDRIRCVLLDLTMPEMDGEAAFHAMREIREDVQVILASGYSEKDVLSRFRGDGLAGFLHKPYRFKLLKAMVREVLEE
jgi:PAS domain S-box-containing protein